MRARDFINEKRRKKKRNPATVLYYGYPWGYTGDSSGDSGDGGGMSESSHDAAWTDAVDRHTRLRALAKRQGDEEKFNYHHNELRRLYGKDMPPTPDSTFNDDPGGIKVDEIGVPPVSPSWPMPDKLPRKQPPFPDPKKKISEYKPIEPHEPGYQHSLLTMPANTLVIDTPGELDWYKIGQHFPTLNKEDPHEYGQSESDMVINFASPEEMAKFAKVAQRLGLKIKSIGGSQEHPEIHAEPKLENFADGRVKGKSRPGRVKRAGASCQGSVTSLRQKAAKYGGEKGKMYHWCSNMKSGKKK